MRLHTHSSAHKLSWIYEYTRHNQVWVSGRSAFYCNLTCSKNSCVDCFRCSRKVLKQWKIHRKKFILRRQGGGSFRLCSDSRRKNESKEQFPAAWLLIFPSATFAPLSLSSDSLSTQHFIPWQFRVEHTIYDAPGRFGSQSTAELDRSSTFGSIKQTIFFSIKYWKFQNFLNVKFQKAISWGFLIQQFKLFSFVVYLAHRSP